MHDSQLEYFIFGQTLMYVGDDKYVCGISCYMEAGLAGFYASSPTGNGDPISETMVDCIIPLVIHQDQIVRPLSREGGESITIRGNGFPLSTNRANS